MKQKIILFDGHDNAGKTTIAKTLSRVLSIPYFRFSNNYWKNNQYKLATYFDQPFLASLLQQTEQSLIIDRGYPSEFVYGQVFKRDIDLDFIKKLDEKFAEIDTKIIICIKESNVKKDEVVPIEKQKEIIQKYKEFYEFSKCDKLLLNTDDEDIRKQLVEIFLYFFVKKDLK